MRLILMSARITRALLIVGCAVALTGCWHRETQQQKFMDALNHGNGAQASQIWLHMDSNSRAEFAHSEGMQPNMSADDVKSQVIKHYQDKMGAEQGEGEETVEQQAPTVHLGGLESLPEYKGPTEEAPPTMTVPTTNEPSN